MRQQEDERASLAGVGGGDVEIEDRRGGGRNGAVVRCALGGSGGGAGDGDDQVRVLVATRQSRGAGLRRGGGRRAAALAAGCGERDRDTAALAGRGGHVDVVFVVLARGAFVEVRAAVQRYGAVAADGESGFGGGADVALELGCWGCGDATPTT